MPKNEKLISENKKPVEEVRYLEEQELLTDKQFISPVFSYGTPEEAKQLSVTLNGTDKKNVGWQAREIQMSDMLNYKKLLSDVEVMKYYHQETIWTEDRIEK